MADHKKDRVETAAVGIEEDVISLTERLRQKGDGDPVEHDLRLLEALLFAASEPIDVETLRERCLLYTSPSPRD